MKKIHRLNFALEEELYERIRKIAFDKHISIAELIRELLLEKFGCPKYNSRD